MSCPAVRSVAGLTIACTKKLNHYGPKSPHRSSWVELGIFHRMSVGASMIRVEWFDA